MPWLSDLFPGLPKQALGWKGRLLREQGFELTSKINEDGKRRTWVEESKNNQINEPALESALERAIQRILTSHEFQETKIKDLEVKVAVQAEEIKILREENDKLRCYSPANSKSINKLLQKFGNGQ